MGNNVDEIRAAQPTCGVRPVDGKRFNPSDYTVLVIDDDTRILDGIARWLRDSGYNVQQANTINAVKERLGVGGIHLVVSDNSIEQRFGADDGINLRRYMLENPALSGIPFILVTASAGEIEPEKIAGLNISTVIGKPFRLPFLEQSIKATLLQEKRKS